jgi:hypothetical protein
VRWHMYLLKHTLLAPSGWLRSIHWHQAAVNTTIWPR